MDSSFNPHLSFYFNEKETAPLFRENQGVKQKQAKAKARVHFSIYKGEEGQDYYAVAAKRILSKEEPSLNLFSKIYNIIVADPNNEGVYYKVNRNSLVKRFNFNDEQLDELVNEKGIAKKEFFRELHFKRSLAFVRDAFNLKEKLASCKTAEELIDILKNRNERIIKIAFKNFVDENYKSSKCEKLYTLLSAKESGNFDEKLSRRKESFLDKFKMLCRNKYREDSSAFNWFTQIEAQEIEKDSKNLINLLEQREEEKRNFSFISPRTVRLSNEESDRQKKMINAIRNASESERVGFILDLKNYLSILLQDFISDHLHHPTGNSYQDKLASFIFNLSTLAFTYLSEKEKLELTDHLFREIKFPLQEFFEKSFAFISIESKKNIIDQIIDDLDSSLMFDETFLRKYLTSLEDRKYNSELNLFDAVRLFRNKSKRELMTNLDWIKVIVNNVKPDAVGIVVHYTPKEYWRTVIEKLREADPSDKQKKLDFIKKEMSEEDLITHFPE